MHPCDLKFLTAREKKNWIYWGMYFKLCKWQIKQWKKESPGSPVQWLGVHALTAKRLGSIPGWETKIPQAKGEVAFYYHLYYRKLAPCRSSTNICKWKCILCSLLCTGIAQLMLRHPKNSDLTLSSLNWTGDQVHSKQTQAISSYRVISYSGFTTQEGS